MKLYKEGLVIFLDRDNGKSHAEYQACTHGGWAKYIPGIESPTANFESKEEVLADARRRAGRYFLDEEGFH